MGYGTWTTQCYTSYSAMRGRDVDTDTGRIIGDYSAQSMFQNRHLDSALDPKNVIVREARDSDEHPNSMPVILALDVTGSMGASAVEAAKSLNQIMTKVLSERDDIQFMVMGIGDLAYDHAPFQVSQFESDIRIAEQLDKLYFEGGGGGNDYESYTQAWWFGAYHTDCDCWKRGEKGILITLGDEPLNPKLDRKLLNAVTQTVAQENLDTKDLYNEVSKKYDVYHICIPTYTFNRNQLMINQTWGSVLPEEKIKVAEVDNLPTIVADIIINATTSNNDNTFEDEIAW